MVISDNFNSPVIVSLSPKTLYKFGASTLLGIIVKSKLSNLFASPKPESVATSFVF